MGFPIIYFYPRNLIGSFKTPESKNFIAFRLKFDNRFTTIGQSVNSFEGTGFHSRLNIFFNLEGFLSLQWTHYDRVAFWLWKFHAMQRERVTWSILWMLFRAVFKAHSSAFFWVSFYHPSLKESLPFLITKQHEYELFSCQFLVRGIDFNSSNTDLGLGFFHNRQGFRFMCLEVFFYLGRKSHREFKSSSWHMIIRIK